MDVCQLLDRAGRLAIVIFSRFFVGLRELDRVGVVTVANWRAGLDGNQEVVLC
jgi:hypothetical protein